MMLNAIAGYLLVGTPVPSSAQIIRGVPRALLAAADEGAATAQRRSVRRRVQKVLTRLMCEGMPAVVLAALAELSESGKRTEGRKH
jgi:hypothetical protein